MKHRWSIRPLSIMSVIVYGLSIGGIGCGQSTTDQESVQSTSKVTKEASLSGNEQLAIDFNRSGYINEINGLYSGVGVDPVEHRAQLAERLGLADATESTDEIVLDLVMWRGLYDHRYHELSYILITKLQNRSDTADILINAINKSTSDFELTFNVFSIATQVAGADLYSYMSERLLSPMPKLVVLPGTIMYGPNGEEYHESRLPDIAKESALRTLAIESFYRCYKATQSPPCRDVLESVVVSTLPQGLRKASLKYLYASGVSTTYLESIAKPEDVRFIGPMIDESMEIELPTEFPDETPCVLENENGDIVSCGPPPTLD